VADASSVAYDALKMAVEHVLGKIREGKKLSTEDVLILYLGTIVGDLKEIRTDIARLDHRIDETNKRIDEIVKTLSARIDHTNQRIDEIAKSLSARIDETNRRIDEISRSLSARIDETNKRIDDLARSLSARIDETNKRIDDLAKRIDAVQSTLLEIQKLLLELVKTRQSTP
jgi:methyl-accepting chemotaxis protein